MGKIKQVVEKLKADENLTTNEVLTLISKFANMTATKRRKGCF